MAAGLIIRVMVILFKRIEHICKHYTRVMSRVILLSLKWYHLVDMLYNHLI